MLVVEPKRFVEEIARNLDKVLLRNNSDELVLADDGQGVHYERNVPAAIPDALQQAGYAVTPTRAVGRLNVVHCPRGPVEEPESCTAAADPRGNGLAAIAR